MREGFVMTFGDMVNDLVCFSEIREIPGIEERIENILHAMWFRFPEKCEEHFIRKPTVT